MTTSGLVCILENDAAARLSTFQVERVQVEAMDKLRSLVTYLAENRSLKLVHLLEDQSTGTVTAYLSGDGASLELFKARVESVFPDLEVSLERGLGHPVRKAA